MFTVVRGNNGRTIYIGKVIAKNDHGFQLAGTEWNGEMQCEEERQISCRFDPGVLEKSKKIKVNNYLLVMMMPSRDDPNQGIAEELGFLGEVMRITNEKGNEKKVVMGVLRNQKRSKNGTSSLLSMTNLSENGQWIGNPSDYVGRNGENRTNYWTTFIACNSQKFNKMLADRVERVLMKKDIVLVVYHCTNNDFNGEIQISNFIDNFYLLYRPQQNNQSHPQQNSASNNYPPAGAATSQNNRTAPAAPTNGYAPTPNNGYAPTPNNGYNPNPNNRCMSG